MNELIHSSISTIFLSDPTVCLRKKFKHHCDNFVSLSGTLNDDIFQTKLNEINE